MQAPAYNQAHAEQLLHLSDLLNKPVLIKDEKIGALGDLVIVDKDLVAEVTHVMVRRPFGRPSWFVPWQYVHTLTDKSLVLDPATPTDSLPSDPERMLLLQDYIVDKKVLDVEGREVEVVYDVMLALQKNHLYVVGVDISRRSLLRRIGLRWLANLTAGITDRMENDVVAWNLVEPLPENIGSFAGDLKIKVVKQELSKMPTVDVARILEQLTNQQRLAIIDGLNPEDASDALEELDPKAQRELIAAMPKEKVARLINAMTPGQAADVLAVLPWSEVRAVLRLLDPEKKTKVADILENQESLAGDYVSSDFVQLRPGDTVRQARQHLLDAKARDSLAYLYIVDEVGKLLGVIDTTDLLTSADETPLSQIMKGNLTTLNAQSTLGEAAELFGRYRYRAIPVLDDRGRMLGIIPYRDVMDLKHGYFG